MQKKIKLFIGIDIAKLKLDVCMIQDPHAKQHDYFVVNNDKKGLQQLLKRVQKHGLLKEEIIFCFETTGVYAMPLCFMLQENNFLYSMVPAIEIKRAKGLTRGKSDKADAHDIAQYSITHEHQLSFTTLPENDLMELKLLLTEREKLVKTILLFSSTKENEGFVSKESSKQVLKHNQKTILLLRKQLAEIEKLIAGVIKRNETIQQQFELIQSVPGVGKQTAIQLILVTRCFSAFDNWRKLACYAGLAPFEYSSGTSIKGKTKVSHLANKKLKATLNLAALSAKKHDTQLKEYYERKTKEGKNGMLIMNAIRCKIISRVFATIKRGTPFVDCLKYSA